MIMTILEDLFFGNIDPNTSFSDEDRRHSQVVQSITANEDKLMGLLEGREKELFVNFSNTYAEFTASTAVNKFALGFRLGALLMADVFTSPNNGVR